MLQIGLSAADPAALNGPGVVTMTGPQTTAHSWAKERGVIDEMMLRRHIPDALVPVYYLAGSPAMVTAMQEMLRNAGVAAQDIRFEEFYGY